MHFPHFSTPIDFGTYSTYPSSTHALPFPSWYALQYCTHLSPYCPSCQLLVRHKHNLHRQWPKDVGTKCSATLHGGVNNQQQWGDKNRTPTRELLRMFGTSSPRTCMWGQRHLSLGGRRYCMMEHSRIKQRLRANECMSHTKRHLSRTKYNRYCMIEHIRIRQRLGARECMSPTKPD